VENESVPRWAKMGKMNVGRDLGPNPIVIIILFYFSFLPSLIPPILIFFLILGREEGGISLLMYKCAPQLGVVKKPETGTMSLYKDN
jgi:hypothetical protein